MEPPSNSQQSRTQY
jgi:hypothetical protein